MDERVENEESPQRSWPVSLLWAAVIVGVSIGLSATVNPLFGRYVHWDWMAGVAPVSFILLLLAFRRRCVHSQYAGASERAAPGISGNA